MEHKTLEEDLAILLEKSRSVSTFSFQELIEILSGKGRSLILIFLSLPFCQPIQIPGMSTLFGIVIAFIGLRIAFGKQIWLPKRILLKTISAKTIEKIAQRFLQMMKKIGHWIHPRYSWVCKNGAMQLANGLMIFFLGLFLALPLPIPLTNLAAAWSILLINLGLLEEDGLFVCIGYAVAVLSLLFFIFILFSIKIAF